MGIALGATLTLRATPLDPSSTLAKAKHSGHTTERPLDLGPNRRSVRRAPVALSPIGSAQRLIDAENLSL
jgi:hypothetical protein